MKTYLKWIYMVVLLLFLSGAFFGVASSNVETIIARHENLTPSVHRQNMVYDHGHDYYVNDEVYQDYNMKNNGFAILMTVGFILIIFCVIIHIRNS